MSPFEDSPKEPAPSPADLLPHKPPMVLIDRVLQWDDARILCSAASHRRPDNPLRCRDRLSAFSGIEYAAQAMAAHAKLAAASDQAPRTGFVATASKVVAHVDRLDTITAELEVEAVQIASTGDSSVYGFTLRTTDQTLLEGQLMVVQEQATP